MTDILLVLILAVLILQNAGEWINVISANWRMWRKRWHNRR